MIGASPRPTSSRPRRRVLAAALVGATALVAASCVQLEQLPPEATQYCLTSPPASAADYQQALDGVRTVWTEWAAADGAFPIDLPDQRVLWLFGDTIVGRVRTDGSIADPWKIVRNSLVMQDGRCFTPMMAGARGARTETIANPAASEWFWPTAGVVENGGTRLRIFMLHMRAEDNPNTEQFDFEFVDIRVATFSLPALTYQGTSGLAGLPSMPAYGESLLAPGDGYLYLYGHAGVFLQSDPQHFVARVPEGHELDPAPPWEYLADVGDPVTSTPPTWSSLPKQAAAVPFDPDGADPDPFDSRRGPLDALNVIARGPGDFLATAKPVGALSPEIVTYGAPTPFGPWTFLGNAATGTPHDLAGSFSYAAQIVTFLPGASPVLIYSQNRNPLADVIRNNQWYKPVFGTPLPDSLS